MGVSGNKSASRKTKKPKASVEPEVGVSEIF